MRRVVNDEPTPPRPPPRPTLPVPKRLASACQAFARMPRPAGAKTPHNARATPSPFAAERTQAAPPRNGKQTYRHTDQSNLSIDQVDSLRRQSNLSTLSLSPRRPSLARSSSTATTTRAPRRGTPLAYATGNGAGGDRTEDDSGFLGQSVDEAAPWTMVDRLRNWRNDAMTQHLYDSAKFWGGKVLGITGASPRAFTSQRCGRGRRLTLSIGLLARRQRRRRVLARPDPLPHAPVCASRAHSHDAATTLQRIYVDRAARAPDRHEPRVPVPRGAVPGPPRQVGGGTRDGWAERCSGNGDG